MIAAAELRPERRTKTHYCHIQNTTMLKYNLLFLSNDSLSSLPAFLSVLQSSNKQKCSTLSHPRNDHHHFIIITSKIHFFQTWLTGVKATEKKVKKTKQKTTNLLKCYTDSIIFIHVHPSDPSFSYLTGGSFWRRRKWVWWWCCQWWGNPLLLLLNRISLWDQ